MLCFREREARTGGPGYAATAEILPCSAVHGLRTTFENRTSMRASFRTGPGDGLHASEMHEMEIFEAGLGRQLFVSDWTLMTD